MLKLKRSSTWP